MPKYPIRPDEERPPKVALGSRVEIELVDESEAAEKLNLTLVPDRQADFEAGLLGVSTPLARVLLGQRAGSTLRYRQGDIVEVRVLDVARGLLPQGDAEAARQAIIDEAIDKSDLADAIQLALTVNVKWGDYDPAALVPAEPEEEEQDKEE